ncbi:MAG: DUF3793 family protein [Bacillota bacterium]|nr:DUF3793 family protein [Bacillota bacterium]
MSDDTIVRHCAPTLAGLKTGNIFTVAFHSEQVLDEELQRLEKVLSAKGLRIVKLRVRDGRALIYVYRPHRLQSDLVGHEAREILRRYGYDSVDSHSCIRRLVERIETQQGFPHEIGLFLGYPPEDVSGFIDCCGKNCKLCGYWKVYGDVHEAEKRFAKFKKCTCVYLKCLQKGVSLSRLAVDI